MKPETLRDAGECLHGHQWQTGLAHDLNINPRTMRGWMQTPPRNKIPAAIAGDLVIMLEQRQHDINRVLIRLKIKRDINRVLIGLKIKN